MILCSGPGAADAIMWSENISFASAVLSVVLVIALFFFKKVTKKIRTILLVLLLIHPWIWLNARSGDCGYVMRFSSIGFSVLFLALWLFFVLRKTAPPKQMP